jgi:hypothetical protein
MTIRTALIQKATESGFRITEDAINALQAYGSLDDPLLILDKILHDVISVQREPPVVTLAHVTAAVLSYVYDDMVVVEEPLIERIGGNADDTQRNPRRVGRVYPYKTR